MSLTRWRETGGEFRFDGHRIFIRDAGAGDEALLLLHGFPTASWDFEAMWPGLTRRFARTVTLDLLGFGFSDKPPRHRYSVHEQADLVESLIASLGIRRVHLLAHDYGALVAQELLARMQERGAAAAQLASCVLLNAALFPEVYHPPLMQRLLLGPLAPLYLRLAGPRRFARVFSPLFGAQTQPGMIELHDYWTLIGQQRGTRALAALFRFVEERRRQRVRWRQALTGTRMPMRLICGGDDPVAGRETAERYRQLIEHADVVMLDGIGHFPHVEAPDRTLRAFVAFHDAHF
jgi:pimeloyl-ACP methyl ester carboxylesterase